MKNLRKICEEYLKGEHRIEIIDLVKNPSLARDHQIIALPTLVRKLPVPIRKIIGNLVQHRAGCWLVLDVKPRTRARPAKSGRARPAGQAKEQRSRPRAGKPRAKGRSRADSRRTRSRGNEVDAIVMTTGAYESVFALGEHQRTEPGRPGPPGA